MQESLGCMACVGGSQDSTLAALMKEMDGAAKACDAGELQREEHS